MDFKDLNINKQLLRALEDNNYATPTPIQQQAFSVIMSGKDVIGIAQTGTGKTFAFLLPLLTQMKYSKEGQPRLLIVVPTRELVLQVVSEIEKLTNYMSLRALGVYGGVNIKTHRKQIYEGLDILVATPGRLLDLVLCGALKTKTIKKLVIDEVDEMLNLGFRTQLKNILDLLPQKRQSILFSATLTEEVEKLIKDFFDRPQKIEVAPTGTPIDKISQLAYFVPNFQTKVALLKLLLTTDNSLQKVLVFVKNKKLADQLHQEMELLLPEKVGVVHSNKSQNYRINAVKQFQEENYKLLITTDLMARGLDFQNVSHVINFHLPQIAEDYIHRIGRTGRAEKEGIAINFITDFEKIYQQEIETLMNKEIAVLALPQELEISAGIDPDEVEKKITGDDINYLKPHSIKNSQGAFHEKKEKNAKNHSDNKYQRILKNIAKDIREQG